MRRRIFVSAVTTELGSYRPIVDECLRLKGDYEPVYQELLPHTDQPITELLKGAIGKCDAAICLVGWKYGSAPRRPIPGYEGCSWAHLEYYFSRERSKDRIPVFVFLASTNVPPDTDLVEADEYRQLQLEFRKNVTDDRNYREFGSSDQLRAGVLALRFPWEQREAYGTQRVLAVLAAILIALWAAWSLRPAGPRAPLHDVENGTAISADTVPEEPAADSPAPMPQPVWQQVNLRLVTTDSPEARKRLPPSLISQIINGPFAFSGSEDGRRIDEIRTANQTDTLPRELLFVSEIHSAPGRPLRLQLRDVRGVALLCEWCPAAGEAMALRNKRVLFPDDLTDQSYQEYEWDCPAGDGVTSGWIAIWAFPLDAEGLIQLGGDVWFEPPNHSFLMLNVKTPWGLSWVSPETRL